MKLYYCKKCNYSCSRKQAAVKHLNSIKHKVGYNNRNLRVKCDFCRCGFPYKSQLEIHKKSDKHKKNVELSKIDLSKIYNIIIIDHGIPKKISNGQL